MEPDPFASAVDQAPVILLFCEGPDLVVAGFNASMKSLIEGRSALGRPLGEVLPEIEGQQFLEAFRQAYRTESPVGGHQWRAHLDTPDGTVNEIYVNFSITPWRWPDGRLRGVIGAGLDVTDMVRARLAAEEQTAHLRVRYERSLDVVTALQQELLPAGLPVLPGVQVAASYLLADADTAAGGDWFDVVPRPDGTVALVVGDVVGHGVAASGVMGQLRAVLQDRLDSGDDPGRALAAADRIARRLPQAHATTVCLVVLDPGDGTLTYCTAGHPPPLVIAAAGDTRYLPGTGGTPLGTGGSFPLRTDRLEVGDLILLYTDGIVERPGRAIPASTVELARVVADSAAGRALHDPTASPAERVCAQTVELLVRASGHSDDITLLAAQRVRPPAGLDLRLPAELSSLRKSRAEIADWLDRLGATARDTFSLQHALGELITNAVEHAFGGELGRDEVLVQATLTGDGYVEARVTDHGRWREPSRQPSRGRGLALTAQLVETLRVTPAEAGTVATLRLPLTRPARMLTGDFPSLDRPAATVSAADLSVTELPGDQESQVRLDGPLDATTAPRLVQELLRRSRGGTVPMTVDLTGITHLSSAGVSALHHVAARHRAQSAPLTLHAAPGTPAGHVLALVSLV